MIWDLAIIENGGYGDLTMNGNDLAVCNNIETAIYLAMVGGNVEADTVSPRPTLARDYWANTLFMGQLKNAQFNSRTERVLNTTPLTSNGRIIIESAIKKDLSFLSNVTVSVSIVSTDRINVNLKTILQNGSEKIKIFSFVYNPSTGDFDLNDFDFSDFF